MASDKVDGQPGGAILKRFTLAFYYSHKVLYSWPNSSASSPFPQVRAFGLRLVPTTGKENGALIEAVSAGTSAAAAGLRVGDVVYKIDGVGAAGLDDDAL